MSDCTNTSDKTGSPLRLQDLPNIKKGFKSLKFVSDDKEFSGKNFNIQCAPWFILSFSLVSVFCAVDVAIGAPEEDDYGGAVYIYQGDATGIVKKYSMVIKLFISILLYCILCN